MSVLRFLSLLSLVVWVGGIVFFAFVVAPALFSILPTRDLAGAVVTRSLNALHWMGIVAAIVFLITSMVWSAIAAGNARLLAAKHVLVGIMLVLTLISQFGVSARMHRLRTRWERWIALRKVMRGASSSIACIAGPRRWRPVCSCWG